jgi:hypothetical protein
MNLLYCTLVIFLPLLRMLITRHQLFFYAGVYFVAIFVTVILLVCTSSTRSCSILLTEQIFFCDLELLATSNALFSHWDNGLQ